MDRCSKCGAWLTYPCYETNGTYNYDSTGVCIVCGYDANKEIYPVSNKTESMQQLNTNKSMERNTLFIFDEFLEKK